ncbi:MAG: hypothetical protein HOP95_07675 [Sphingomonas sp.]|nr:hypothetical protein [Sphingomonas sp.]
MPTFHITVHNEDFTSSDDYECACNEEALKQGIKSAIAIASDQVSSGKPFFGAEMTLEQGNKQLIRYIVAIGASPLKAQ